MDEKIAALLYQLGMVYDKLETLRDVYPKGDRPANVDLVIKALKFKIVKIKRQISELD